MARKFGQALHSNDWHLPSYSRVLSHDERVMHGLSCMPPAGKSMDLGLLPHSPLPGQPGQKKPMFAANTHTPPAAGIVTAEDRLAFPPAIGQVAFP